MEQRNEMLRNMRLSERQKKGDVQHLLSRSFSQRGFSNLQSPPADISIPVPQFPIPPIIHEEKPKDDEKETVSIGECVCMYVFSAVLFTYYIRYSGKFSKGSFFVDR